MLSEKRQKLYEAAGWERIKLELEVGDFHFVPVDTFARQQARDWAEAKEREDRAAEEARFQLEQRRFDELRRWRSSPVSLPSWQPSLASLRFSSKTTTNADPILPVVCHTRDR